MLFLLPPDTIGRGTAPAPTPPLPDRVFCALGPGIRLGFFWDILFLFYFCKVRIHQCSVATQCWGGTWKLPGQKM